MPYDHTCTACNHVDAIAGVLSQETLESRLAGKNTEIGLLKSSLTTAESKASNYDAISLERDGLKTKIEGLEQASARSALYAEHGIGAGLEADKATQVRSTFEAIYASETTGVEGAPSYGDWLGADDGAKAHPLLSSGYGTPGAPAPVAPTTPTAGPTSDTGTRPAVGGAPNGLRSKDGVRAHFQSDAYKAKPPAERRAEYNRMRAEAQASTGPTAT